MGITMTKQVGSQSRRENRLTSHLGLQYPIIQGPLGGLSSQRLTAAVSNYGGLGSFGAHGLKPEAIRKVIREIKDLTAKPFAMNLWVSMEDEGAFTSTEEAFHRSLSSLTQHIESVEGAKPSYRAVKSERLQHDEGSYSELKREEIRSEFSRIIRMHRRYQGLIESPRCVRFYSQHEGMEQKNES
jgi:Nitronate monooxygenase